VQVPLAGPAPGLGHGAGAALGIVIFTSAPFAVMLPCRRMYWATASTGTSKGTMPRTLNLAGICPSGAGGSVTAKVPS